jgi:hypothetical protein
MNSSDALVIGFVVLLLFGANAISPTLNRHQESMHRVIAAPLGNLISDLAMLLFVVALFLWAHVHFAQ